MKIFSGLILIAMSAAFAGCLGSQSETTMDEIGGAVGAGDKGTAQPYVEAFIEYPGPQAKWAGPASFMVHVNARQPGHARITVTPDLFKPATELAPGRVPAQSKQVTTPVQQMTTEVARAQLGILAATFQGPELHFQGCLSPVRVRMIRADGIIAEKQGCRDITGWPHAASEAVNRFLASVAN